MRLPQALNEFNLLGGWQSDSLEDNKKQHLPHRPGSSMRQPGVIQSAPGLDNDWCPTEVRFQRGSRGKIVNRADRCDRRSSHHRADPWKRQANLSLACMLDNANDFVFQPLDMFTKKA